MARDKKYRLIDETFELLKTHRPQELTIRMIADASECTSTVIYRHFDNLDHLILVSSVRFLEYYIVDVDKILSSDADAVETLIEMWRVFAVEAFANVDVFELLFWSNNSERLSEAIIDYYQLFPKDWQSLNGFFASVYFSSSLEERNAIVVQKAAADGFFPNKDIRLFSDLQCYLFHGLLMEYRNDYREPGKAEEGIERFMSMLRYLIDNNRKH